MKLVKKSKILDYKMNVQKTKHTNKLSVLVVVLIQQEHIRLYENPRKYHTD